MDRKGKIEYMRRMGEFLDGHFFYTGGRWWSFSMEKEKFDTGGGWGNFWTEKENFILTQEEDG